MEIGEARGPLREEDFVALPEPAQPATGTPATPAAGSSPPALTGSQQELAAEALAAYDRAQAALATGDWATYGAELATVQRILEQLSGTPVAVPSGTT